MKSWQPILTPKSVLPLLLIIAIIFTPLGIALVLTTYSVQQLVVVYDSCATEATSEFTEIPSKYVSNHFKGTNSTDVPYWKLAEDNDEQICSIKFNVPTDINKPFYLYYRLTNFYQNHREYVSSYDLAQIKGTAVAADSINEDCDPLATRDGKAIYPCGLIANSLFNDTFTSPYNPEDTSDVYEMTDVGISWSVDRNRFKQTSYTADQIVPPPNWMAKYPDGYTDDNIPDLATWEALQVWMRTAGLPNFMKLALKSTESTFSKGTYVIDIGLYYPVTIFGGTKAVVLSSSSVIGGRNLSLGIAYLVVAGLVVLFGIIFLVKYVIKPRKLGDHSYLNFNERAEDFNETQPGRREIL